MRYKTPQDRKAFFFRKETPVFIRVVQGILAGFILFQTAGLFLTFQRVKSNTMHPALKKGDVVMISKIKYGITLPFFNFEDSGKTIVFSKPKRGDIVLLKDTTTEDADMLLSALSSFLKYISLGKLNIIQKNYLIKRVIALPKDKIEIKDKTVYLNDKVLYETRKVHNDERILEARISSRDNMEAIIVPYNSYFLLGDNRDYNYDSREFGAVHFRDIIGKVAEKDLGE